ncbi:MAG: hypothetical protein LBD07_01390 [Spirochaetaceae bacterium]|nr:hypothetical protein [Spirochaetaceae bacterium]
MLKKLNLFFLITAVLCLTGQSSSGVVPEIVRRPEFIDNFIYPYDVSVGELGVGSASLDALLYARRALTDVQQANARSAILAAISEKQRLEALEKVVSVTSRKFRLGGGQIGIDGSTSFAFRFMGREKECVGAIYMRENNDNAWRVEDIIIEEPRPLPAAGNESSAWTPYDRFY